MRHANQWAFESLQQAASYTHTPLSILREAKKSGCLAFKKGGRVDYLLFLHWFWARGSDNKGLPPEFNSWREMLDCEKAKREALRRQREEGEMMSVDDAKQQASEAMGLLFSELERISSELPPDLAGLDAVEICARMRHRVEKLRAELAAKFDEIGAC